MPGMQELPDANISFYTASGRIVEAFAKTEQNGEKILSFYKNVLPQLGWRVEKDTIFVRDTEILILDLRKDGGSVIVQFSLKPQ